MLLGAANAEAFSFRSLLSFLSKNDQVGAVSVVAKDKYSRVSFFVFVPMVLHEGHVAAHFYYCSFDTLEQAGKEACNEVTSRLLLNRFIFTSSCSVSIFSPR
jgi:hypothetical protein